MLLELLRRAKSRVAALAEAKSRTVLVLQMSLQLEGVQTVLHLTALQVLAGVRHLKLSYDVSVEVVGIFRQAELLLLALLVQTLKSNLVRRLDQLVTTLAVDSLVA